MKLACEPISGPQRGAGGISGGVIGYLKNVHECRQFLLRHLAQVEAEWPCHVPGRIWFGSSGGRAG